MAALVGLAAACGDEAADRSDGRPSVVVTTTILGDIVGTVVGDAAAVEVVFPAGVDPHDFEPSSRQAEAMASADLLVINGAGLEAGLDDLIAAAEDDGADVFAFADHVDLLEGRDASEPGVDPHIWTDPARMAGAIEALGERLGTVPGLEAGAVAGRTQAYAAEVRAADAEVEALVAELPGERRVLVTNHEVLGYFADRYGFEVIGTVIPSVTTGAEASAAELEALAEVIRIEDVPAIFAEETSSTRLAEALADSVGRPIQVVELHTESLGGPGSGAETYLELVRTDARLLTEALAGATAP